MHYTTVRFVAFYALLLQFLIPYRIIISVFLSAFLKCFLSYKKEILSEIY